MAGAAWPVIEVRPPRSVLQSDGSRRHPKAPIRELDVNETRWYEDWAPHDVIRQSGERRTKPREITRTGIWPPPAKTRAD